MAIDVSIPTHEAVLINLKEFAKYWRMKTPLVMQLKKWMFGEADVIPLSHRETFTGKV